MKKNEATQKVACQSSYSLDSLFKNDLDNPSRILIMIQEHLKRIPSAFLDFGYIQSSRDEFFDLHRSATERIQYMKEFFQYPRTKDAMRQMRDSSIFGRANFFAINQLLSEMESSLTCRYVCDEEALVRLCARLQLVPLRCSQILALFSE